MVRHGARHRRSDRPRPAAAADHRRRDFRGVPRWRRAPARAAVCRSRAAGGWSSCCCSASAFIGWVVWFAGTTISAQFEALREVVTAQFDRLIDFRGVARADAQGAIADLGSQLLGGVGRLTSAVGSVIGGVASVIAMIVIGIFLASEPRALRSRHRLDAAAARSRRASTGSPSMPASRFAGCCSGG